MDVVKSVKEVFAQNASMLVPRPTHEHLSARGQDRHDTTTIDRGPSPLDEPTMLESVRKPCEPTSGHQAVLSQIRHPHAVGAGFAQLCQHIVFGHAYVQRSKTRLQLAPEAFVGE